MKDGHLITTHCAICGFAEKKEELYTTTFDTKKINSKTFSARRTPDRMHYRFVRCKKCGLIFSDPILPEKKLNELYKKSGFTYSQESKYLKNTYGYYLSKIIPKKGKVKLLDIGCGDGFFMEEAKNLGATDIFGIEPGAPSVKHAPQNIQGNIKVDILRKGLFKPGTFDIITCFQTLDHIPDPNEFLKITRNLLKKGGKALFIQHNTDGLSVKVLHEKSPIFDVEHIYLFNKKTLKKIFEKNGFKVKGVFDVKNCYPISYWTRMLPFSRGFKKIILPFLDITKIGLIPITIGAGNLGIIAEKI